MRCSTIIRRCIGLLGAAAVSWAGAVETASFDLATGRLTLPLVKIDGNTQFRDVILRLSDPGQLQVNDSAVGSQIEFLSSGNVLRLPQVTVAGVTYPRVSLANPAFSLESYGAVVLDTNLQGQYRLEVQVTAQGFAAPPIVLENVPKPATQDEFCNDPQLRENIIRSTSGITGSWAMNSCSFNGTVGNISMTLTTPFFTLPYSATYTYR
ncbi:MAG: hypothetical protein K2Y10_07890 [Burkholderiaceae bacterium]|nr:hypothetical protein [Burkholderiaceae bacterium]